MPSVTITHDDLAVEVHRDDYLVADKDRLDFALGNIAVLMEDTGWSLEGGKIQGESETISEPLDE